VPPSLRFGKYTIEGLLGPGGVTETYLARMSSETATKAGVYGPEQLYALKLLRPDRVPENGFAKVAERFVSAGQQLRDFHRLGFCKVIDVSNNPSATFIVSEHVAGCDLARLLETSRTEGGEWPGIDPILAGLIGSEMARLLLVGHSAKPVFCHLGLSPTNVVVTEAGEVVLMDAGIAVSLRAITEQPSERWAFVAPELQGVDLGASALSDRKGVAADLYSLGALLYFLLTGQVIAVVSRKTRRTAGELAGLSGVPSKLCAALRTLLAPEPEDRPESAAVLVEWLAGGIEGSRERQRLIASGIRAIESGARNANLPLPPPTSAVERETPPPIKTPGPLVIMSGSASKNPGHKRWSLLAIGSLIALGVVATVVVVGSMGKSSQHTQGGQGEVSQEQNVEMPPSVQTAKKQDERAKGPKSDEPADTEPILARVAGHLIVETVPPGAMVWVDGVLKGKTFADIVVGEGGHRIILIAPGHRMFRDVVDTSKGAIIRRTLVSIDPAVRGNGFLDVECQTKGKFPILIDDEETGLLCPTRTLPTTPGKHTVGIFVPKERRTVAVETVVQPGSKPAVIAFEE
jgi:serine/threonine protein kinase